METNNIHINHESDFTVVFTFPEGERPFYAWQLAFVAGRTSRYVASFDGEKYHNATFKECREDQVRIEFKHHRLGCGLLRYEFKREAPNALFSDGQQGLTDTYTSNITLHEGPSDDSPIPDELIPITQAALRGFSAYEIAIQEGFIGGESDWLESLKGENGHTPRKGVDYFTEAEVKQIVVEAAGLVPLPDVSGQISDHNAAEDAHAYIRQTVANISPRLAQVLPVTIIQTTTSNLTHTFTKADFEAAAQAYTNGAQLFVDITDNRNPSYKTLDLSKRYNAIWNKTLSQIEVSKPEVARGFYLDGATPQSRGCVSDNTATWISAYPGVTFSPSDGTYTVNSLMGFSESDVAQMVVYAANMQNALLIEIFRGYKFRTNISPADRSFGDYVGASSFYNIEGICVNATSVEIFYLAKSNTTSRAISSAQYSFFNTQSLKEIVGMLGVSGMATPAGWNNTFKNAFLLESVTIKGLRQPVVFAESSNLTRGSILYMINNSVTLTTPIAITLHAEALARLTTEDIALASSRNITLTA